MRTQFQVVVVVVLFTFWPAAHCARAQAPPRQEHNAAQGESYFPPPESQGGWRKLDEPDDIRRLAGMDPDKLAELKKWLLASDKRDFAAVVIRNGYVVLEVERGNSAKTDARRVASVSKAICATVLAIASEASKQGKTPKKMNFDDSAYDFIPWSRPLSDPRKAKITVKQLLNHTSGICPEATGAPNDGKWEYVLGHTGDKRTATLAFDPGAASGYSTHAFCHAALVCETVTSKPYDEFAIESLFKPIGCEHWWFQYYDGREKIGRHPSHGMGMPARDLARIAFCMLHGGRWKDDWNERQVIPKWFVDETASPTHDVTTKEMRFKLPAQVFSHGWELPARLTGEDSTPHGRGIPTDARYKPGSGGQLIAFVPSLDLVVTRQTGSSGQWEYAEYLRRACAAVLTGAVLTAVENQPPATQDPPKRTKVSIVGNRWHLNGQPTYPGTAAEGLLMNVRMANSIFEDTNDKTRPKGFDSEKNTDQFISQIPDYAAHGVRAFTICLQGGFPGYEGAVNSAFRPDGSLRDSYLARARRVIEACDQNGVAVILGCYYQRQEQLLKDDDAIRSGVVNVVRWIKANGFTNVVLEIANEFPHGGFDHPLLKGAEGEAELIALAKKTAPDLLVSTSGVGGGTLPDEVARASDFLLIHYNSTSLENIPKRIAALKKYNKPIVCNEDDKVGREGARAAELSVSNGASWGFMHNRVNQYFPLQFNGARDDPLVYETLNKLTTRRP
jgi:CubicO group peptidase (beta-lactamase class C family)